MCTIQFVGKVPIKDPKDSLNRREMNGIVCREQKQRSEGGKVIYSIIYIFKNLKLHCKLIVDVLGDLSRCPKTNFTVNYPLLISFILYQLYLFYVETHSSNIM